MDASDLRAFEAVTRLGGMNRAAAELAGTLLAPPIAQRATPAVALRANMMRATTAFFACAVPRSVLARPDPAADHCASALNRLRSSSSLFEFGTFV